LKQHKFAETAFYQYNFRVTETISRYTFLQKWFFNNNSYPHHKNNIQYLKILWISFRFMLIYTINWQLHFYEVMQSNRYQNKKLKTSK